MSMEFLEDLYDNNKIEQKESSLDDDEKKMLKERIQEECQNLAEELSTNPFFLEDATGQKQEYPLKTILEAMGTFGGNSFSLNDKTYSLGKNSELGGIIQAFLITAGFDTVGDCGIDGSIGPQTVKTIKEYLEHTKKETTITTNKTFPEEETEELKKEIEEELLKVKQLTNGKVSPLNANIIITACKKYNVPIEYSMAMMRNDSHYGTTGKGAKTFNPGNVGNTTDGKTKNRGSRERGVEAVAENLSKRISEFQKIYGSNKMPTLKQLISNQGPDGKGFLPKQGNYKRANTQMIGAYMVSSEGLRKVQEKSDYIRKNIQGVA